MSKAEIESIDPEAIKTEIEIKKSDILSANIGTDLKSKLVDIFKKIDDLYKPIDDISLDKKTYKTPSSLEITKSLVDKIHADISREINVEQLSSFFKKIDSVVEEREGLLRDLINVTRQQQEIKRFELGQEVDVVELASQLNRSKLAPYHSSFSPGARDTVFKAYVRTAADTDKKSSDWIRSSDLPIVYSENPGFSTRIAVKKAKEEVKKDILVNYERLDSILEKGNDLTKEEEKALRQSTPSEVALDLVKTIGVGLANAKRSVIGGRDATESKRYAEFLEARNKKLAVISDKIKYNNGNLRKISDEYLRELSSSEYLDSGTYNEILAKLTEAIKTEDDQHNKIVDNFRKKLQEINESAISDIQNEIDDEESKLALKILQIILFSALIGILGPIGGILEFLDPIIDLSDFFKDLFGSVFDVFDTIFDKDLTMGEGVSEVGKDENLGMQASIFDGVGGDFLVKNILDEVPIVKEISELSSLLLRNSITEAGFDIIRSPESKVIYELAAFAALGAVNIDSQLKKGEESEKSKQKREKSLSEAVKGFSYEIDKLDPDSKKTKYELSSLIKMSYENERRNFRTKLTINELMSLSRENFLTLTKDMKLHDVSNNDINGEDVYNIMQEYLESNNLSPTSLTIKNFRDMFEGKLKKESMFDIEKRHRMIEGCRKLNNIKTIKEASDILAENTDKEKEYLHIYDGESDRNFYLQKSHKYSLLTNEEREEIEKADVSKEDQRSSLYEKFKEIEKRDMDRMIRNFIPSSLVEQPISHRQLYGRSSNRNSGGTQQHTR